MKSKGYLMLGFALLAVTLAMLLWLIPRPGDTSVAQKSHVAKTDKIAIGATGKVGQDADFRGDRIYYNKVDEDRVAKAVASGDIKQWSPALSELGNPKYRREDAIRILQKYLQNANRDIRIRAASLLLQLGSREGISVLQNVIAEAARSDAVSRESVVHAADILQQYRIAIDGQTLRAAYDKIKHPRLLHILTMQDPAQVADLAMQKPGRDGLTYSPEALAIYVGPVDQEAVGKYTMMLQSRHPGVKEFANFALFQATGESSYLDNLIAEAQMAAGMLPKGPDAALEDNRGALRYLQVTKTEKAVQALREIAEYSAGQRNEGMEIFGLAFAALYYTQDDSAYVREKVMSHLRGEWSGPGIDRNLLFHIAATYDTPEARVAAAQINREAYEQIFVRLQGRPVESWINEYVYLGNVPASVRPLSK